jgi:hypothetical protein
VAVAMEAAQQLDPLRGGIVHLEELLVADSRSRAFEMIRSHGPEIRDARGAYMLTVDVGSQQKHCAFGLIGIDSLPLVFPPGGGPA